MKSLRDLYKMGAGPSSSHTLAPQFACQLFQTHYPEAIRFEVDLYGSLALTGKGHHTDSIIEETLFPNTVSVNFKQNWTEDFPSGLEIRGFDATHHVCGEWVVFSLGGGSIEVKGVDLGLNKEVYPEKNLEEVKVFCQNRKTDFVGYIQHYEREIEDYISEVMMQMIRTVNNGLNVSGVLPGKLKLERAAKNLLFQVQAIENEKEKERLLLYAYAYAASEENAAGGICVTAPTLGASGVLAALVYYYYHQLGYTREMLIQALMVAGLFGNIVKQNASISGAVGGCQAEIGVACAMGAAFVSFLQEGNLAEIEYAAEIGVEHHLGLTCDPVGGYVMIPCIERNAVATVRAMDAAFLSKHISRIKQNRVSFDNIVSAMNYTGEKLAIELKETSLGGLALEIQIEGREEK